MVRIRDIRIPFLQMVTVGMLPSPLKILCYRLKGYRIGRGVRIGFGSVIEARRSCTLADDVRIGFFAMISCETLEVGKRTNIRSFTVFMVPHIRMGKDVIISETAIVRAQLAYPDSSIEIGDRAHIFPYCILDPSRRLTIGPESAVGFASYVFTHGAYKNKLDGYPVTFGEVHIGRAVWLPCRVFIMPGVTIGDDAVVGTGSVVTKSVDAGAFVLGQPAKFLKSKDEFISHHDRPQRVEMLCAMLAEFAEFVAHFGEAGVDKVSDAEILIGEGERRRRVTVVGALAADGLARLSRGDVVVSHDDLAPDIRHRLDTAGVAWFTYGGHACSGALDELAEALLEYLQRYGLRFDRP